MYDQEKYGVEYWKNRNNIERKHILLASDWYKFFTPEKVFDYGCGCGQYIHMFDMLGIRAVGYEPSLQALEMATTPLVTSIIPVEKFDLVICMDVLEHVPEKEISDVLCNIKKVASRFIIFSICFADDPAFDTDPTHITRKSREWWVYTMRKHGFVIYETPDDWLWKEQIIFAGV